MSTDLRSYKAMVLAAMRRAQETHKPEVFENSGPDHARVVLEVMLENAKNSVDVICGQMSGDVWPINALSGFLIKNPNARIRVILDDAWPSSIPEGSALNELIPDDRVEIGWIKGHLPRHICVVDKSHVRIETDLTSRVASITFGDPVDIGRRASEIFDKVWDKTTMKTKSHQYA